MSKFKIFSFLEGSIRNKLIAVALVSILLPLISFGVFSYYNVKSLLKDNLITTSQSLVNQVNVNIDEYTSGMEKQMYTLASTNNLRNLNGLLNDNQKFILNGNLKTLKDESPELTSAYFGSANKEMIQYPALGVPAGYDPTTRPWYKKAIEHLGETVWTDVYKSASGGDVMVTVARAVQTPDGHVVGVVAMDIELSALSNKLSASKIGREGYVYIATADGIGVAHPDKASLGNDSIGKEPFWPQIKNNDSGSIEYNRDGIQKYGVYITNKKLNWKISGALTERELDNDAKYIRNAIFISIFIGILLALVFAFWLARYICGPLNQLKEQFIKAADGDLTVKVDIIRTDEFGELADRFNSMVQNINNLVHSVSDMVQNVAASSEQLSASAEQSAQAAGQVAQSVTTVANDAEEQSQSINSTNNIVTQMSSAIDHISLSTNLMADTSTKTAQAADEGSRAVNNAVIQIEKIENTVNTSAQVVARLGERSNEIGQIVEAISGIAGQTNLLALNAAIEAARAGEQGRGFAVVADEVRKLAEQSQEAAKQIGRLIKDIQTDTTQAVDAMNAGTKEVKAGTEVIHRTGEKFNAITEMIESMNDQVSEVTVAVKQLSTDSQQIVVSVKDIDTISRNTVSETQTVSAAVEEQTAAMQEIASSSNGLSLLAEELQTAVNKFKV